MPERNSLLTRTDPRVQPLAAPNVRAPSGAFGDYSGVQDFAQGVGNVADAASQGANHVLRAAMQEADRRDANDIEARFRLAMNEEGQGLQEDTIKAISSGLKHDALMKAVEDSSKVRFKNIDAKLADIKERNQKVYNQIVTPAAKELAWSQRVGSVRDQAASHNGALVQAERYETALANDDILFAATAGNPMNVLQVASSVAADMARTNNLFTPQQRMQRQAAIKDHVAQVLLGAAQVYPNPALEGEARKARDSGLITPGTYARVVDEIKRANNPVNINAELRGTVKAVNDQIKGGDTVDINTTAEATANAITTYHTPEARFNEVLKPHLLAAMEGRLRAAVGNGGLVGGTLYSTQQLAAELGKTESTLLKSLFNSEFSEARTQAYISLPNLREDLKASYDMMPSDTDYASYRTALASAVSKQLDMVEKFQSHELYKDNPGVTQAIKAGDTAALVRVQRSLYDRDGVPENRRVYGSPAEINQLKQRLTMTDEASVGDTVQLIDSFINKFGKDSYGALMSTAQAPGPVSGVFRFSAQRFLALNRDAEQNIVSMLPDLVQAVSWASSQTAKGVAEKNPEFERDTKAYWNAAFSSSYSGEFSAKAAFGGGGFGRRLANELRSSPESSALGQASLRDGTYDSIHSLGQALTQYYAAGKKDELLRPNEAAAKARDIIGRAFIPVSSNGGGNDRPIYTFAPVTARQTSWYTGGSKGAFNSQRHYAQMESAAWDSMFLVNDPKLELGGALQWQFNLALTHAFNGPRVGFNTELAQMPNLNPAFSATVRTNMHTTAFNSRPVDFANLGIVTQNAKGEDVFTPLSEDSIVTDFLPITVREKVAAILKKVDKTDSAGRNQLILANAFQRELNTKTSSWDVYISGGRDYAGTSGTTSKAGPRASVVVKQADGSFKKLAISAVDADNRLEALMAATSYTDRSGSNNQVRKELLGTPVSSIKK